MKTVFKLLGLVVLLLAAAVIGYLYLGDEEIRDVFSFVPDDFVYVIESDHPVKDWKELSDSRIWKYLKTNEYFADISGSADMLDSMLNNNKALVKFIKLGDLLISAHMIGKSEYEFIFLVDLRGLSKLSKLGAGLTAVFESMDYDLSTGKYFGHTIYSLKDPETGDILHLATLDNILVGSYNLSLLKSGINQTEKETVISNSDFFKVREELGRDEIYSLYLNYKVMDKYMKVYTNEVPELIAGLGEILAYSSFDFEVKDDHAFLKGYTKQIDTVPSFLNVFKDVGKGRVLAQEVLPMNTAFFTSVGFDDFADLYNRFDAFYAKESPEEHKELEKNKRFVEKLLDVDIEQDIFSWMTDEVITAVVPVDEKATKYSYYALLHFDDFDKATEKMNFLAEQVRKKTPAKFRETDHNGVPIRYLDIKGFFKVFFKRMFSKIEKPHYAFVGDYVVFSNDVESLVRMIDSYIGQNTLEYDDKFDDLFSEFDSRSNIFTYIRNETFFNYLKGNLDYESKVNIHNNRNYLLSFPQIGFQLYPGGGMYKTYLHAEFDPIEEE